MKKYYLIIIFFCVTNNFCIDQNKTISSLEVTLSVSRTAFQIDEAIILTTTVTNASKSVVKFCKYHSPFEGIANEIFVVTKNGKPLDYQGILKKRVPPIKDDFITLQPEASTSCRVSISEKYNMVNKGEYTIRFMGSSISQLPNSNEIKVLIQ